MFPRLALKPLLAIALLWSTPAIPLSADEPVKVAVITADEASADLLRKALDGRDLELVDDTTTAQALVLHSTTGEPWPDAVREQMAAAAGRGAGLILLHRAIAGADADVMHTLTGAGWTDDSRSFYSRMSLYWITDKHDLVAGVTPFDIDDDTLYDLQADYSDPAISVIASAFTPKLSPTNHPEVAPGTEPKVNIYDIQPQAWAYQGDNHRAMVLLQGRESSLEHHAMQAMILRGIAWTSGHDDVDALLTEEDVTGLRYPIDGARPAEEVAENLQMHPDFTATVVASEPLINKPIAVQWDPAGRLWVAETPEYPNGLRESVNEPWIETGVLVHGHYDREPTDRISILTDPDENGRYTDKIVWYDGLELVSAFCFHEDGIVVAHQPEIIFIRDTNGDGRGDTVETLFQGFHAGDTHFIPNHFIAAPDGWIYANMGGRATPRSADGSREFDPVSAGIFRFKPDGSAIEQVSSKGGNAFGNEVTSSMELFFGQATTGNPLQHVAVPEWLLQRGRLDNRSGAHSVIERRRVVLDSLPERAPLVQIDVVGGYSAACASLIYEGGGWPGEWHRSSFVTEPLLNIVHHEVLKPNGVTYAGEMVREDAEFIFSPDYWFRPIALATAPDGAMHILDFYTQVVAHNDTRGPQHSRSHAAVRPDRDHYFGRIYRVQHRDATELTVPDLTAGGIEEWAAALGHPNKLVRFHALRLLCEHGGDEAIAALQPALQPGRADVTRVLALWGLQRLEALSGEQLRAALTDADPMLRANAALVVEAGGKADNSTPALVVQGLAGEDPQVVIPRLRALAASALDEATAAELVAAVPSLPDDYALGAAVAAASGSPALFLEAALQVEPGEELLRVAQAVAGQLRPGDDGAALIRLLTACVAADPAAAAVIVQVLTRLSDLPRPDEQADTGNEAIQALMLNPDPAIQSAAMPLAVAWDEDGSLTETLRPVVAALLEELIQGETGVDRQRRLISSLLRVRQVNDSILPTLSATLREDRSEDVLAHLLQELGDLPDAAVADALVAAFEKLSPALRSVAIDTLISRAEWALTLLQAIETDDIPVGRIGPANLFRLRTHPSEEVSARADEMMAQMRAASSDKDEIIAGLLPEVSQPGDAAVGRVVFESTCAMCHRHEDLGVDIGPVLTGMGVHGPASLLTHIIDPNRVTEPGNEAWNIETSDGRLLSGIIAQENPGEILLQTAAGEVSVAQDEIVSRTNTGRSLMPEGYEALGTEMLRHLLTYLGANESNHRVIDLSPVFTADTRRGLYHSEDRAGDTLPFIRYGLVEVEGVPFEIADPERSQFGGNVIVLQGGPRDTFSRSMPQEVEVPVGHAARRLHVLGAVAGWGATRPDEGELVMTFRIAFADGETQVVEWFNGVHFTDYNREVDVPGSKMAEGVVRHHAVRYASIEIEHDAPIEKITMQSAGRNIAPTTVAITAEL